MNIIIRTLILTALATMIFALMGFLPPIPTELTDFVTTMFQYMHVFDVIFPMQTLIDVLTWALYIEIGLLSVRIIAVIKRYTAD